MKRNRRHLLVSLPLLLPLPAAEAIELNFDWLDQKLDFYISVQAGHATTGQERFEEDSAWQGFGGIRLGPRFSAELGFVDLGRFRSDDGSGLSLKASGTELGGTMYFPLFSGIRLITKAGALAWWAEGNAFGLDRGDDNGISGTIALGGDWELAPKLKFRAQAQRYAGIGEADVTLYTAGMNYNF